MNTVIQFLKPVLFMSLIVLSSCTKNNTNNSLDPFKPEIANVTDNFQLQATDVKQVTATIDYNWNNTGPAATIDKSGVITAGTARLLIFDKNGTNVSNTDLKVTGNIPTSVGVAGLWKIRLELNGYDGTLNFRVQKK